MALGIFNKDNYFFSLEGMDQEGIIPPVRAITGNLISLTVKEEVGKQTTGSVSLLDNTGIFSGVFREYTTMKVTWGYTTNRDPLSLSDELRNIDQFKTNIRSRSIQAFIQNPSGSFNSGGQQVYNIGFVVHGHRNDRTNTFLDRMTRREVVEFILAQMEVTDYYIDFSRENDRVSARVNYETYYEMAHRTAQELNCFFILAQKTDGGYFAAFVDKDKLQIANDLIARKCLGSTGGRSNFFDWGGGRKNVISGNWSRQQSESTGDAAFVRIINGKTVLVRYNADIEAIETLELNVDKVREAVNEGTVKDRAELLKTAVQAKSIQDPKIKKFFTPVTQRTAPVSFGYRINLKVIGSILHIPMTIAQFGGNLPARLIRKELKGRGSVFERYLDFFIHGVTHKISSSGYYTDIKIKDSLRFTQGHRI